MVGLGRRGGVVVTVAGGRDKASRLVGEALASGFHDAKIAEMGTGTVSRGSGEWIIGIGEERLCFGGNEPGPG